jgi:hypothetical protein
MNIKENNNSLSFFLPFTLTPSRDARPRVFMCVCEVGVKEGKKSRWPASWPHGRADVGPRRHRVAVVVQGYHATSWATGANVGEAMSCPQAASLAVGN